MLFMYMFFQEKIVAEIRAFKLKGKPLKAQSIHS